MIIKAAIRFIVAQLLFSIGATHPKRRLKKSLSIVTFHRVLNERERRFYPFPGLVVTPKELDLFLAYFSDHFDCGPLRTQHARYLSGERLAKPLLAVTFDDGNKDNHSNARPILGQHHIHATFFVPVLAVQRHELLWHDRLGFALAALLSRDSYGPTRVSQILSEAGLKLAGKNDLVAQTVAKAKKLGHFAREELIETLAKLAPVPREASFAGPMTFKELADLVADGHEIGSHSMSHVLMTECGDQQLYYELSESKKILQQKLGVEVESFCYPNGDVDARTENAVGIAGYRRAVTTDWGSNDTSVDRFRLNRFDMDAAYCRFHAGNVLPALIAYRMSRTSRR